MIDGVIAFLLTLIVIVAVAIPMVNAQNTSALSAGQLTMYQQINTVLVLVLLVTAFGLIGYGLYSAVGKKRK